MGKYVNTHGYFSFMILFIHDFNDRKWQNYMTGFNQAQA